VWPGILSNAGAPPPSTTGFALPPGQTLAVTVASAWSGRIWGRTLCATDSSGAFACATADCDSGAVECSGRGAAPPATLAEFTLAGGTGAGDDFYDVSLVDGFNVPMLVAPRSPPPPANNGSCQATGCAADLNRACPAELRVAGAGAAQTTTVACRSACEAFAEAQYCCSGVYGSPASCAPTSYSRLFKAACPAAYSYAYDDATSTFTCAAAGGGYVVVFCPGTSRYARTLAVVRDRTYAHARNFPPVFRSGFYGLGTFRFLRCSCCHVHSVYSHLFRFLARAHVDKLALSLVYATV
jgi:hypothetical protein